jgi:large subunit ribosomal protein L6
MNLKYKIKIPNTLNIFYCSKKNILIVKGPLKQKSIKLKIKLLISKNNSLIFVTTIPCFKIANNEKKNLKAICGSTFTQIKTLIAETSTIIYKKLKIVGVGYRGFKVKDYENRLLLLKLGYSHPIYLKIPENLEIFCLKFTKLFIYGNSYKNIILTASLIKRNKIPEPYKGKGILYENETIQLKQGKKV